LQQVAAVLETERLRLCGLEERHFEEYAAMCADPEVMRFLGGQTLNRQLAWRNLAAILGHWQLRGYGFYALEEKATGKLVGRAGLWRPEGWQDLEVGWALARDSWGKGYALEAARACVDEARRSLKAKHIISYIDPANVRSLRVAERLGEKYEGKGEVLGNPVDVYGMAL
jgi:RimJ/RimL family protein N-acetyltransferase